MMKTTSLGLLALVLGATQAAAQAPAQQPARAPEPPPPARVEAPPPRQPARATPPTAGAAAASAAPASQATVTGTPVRPMTRSGAPADSVRPAEARAIDMPANAVAQCVDGTFIVAPGNASACSSHRGVLVRFPVRTPPPRPGTTAPQAVAARPVPKSSPATAPAGSTMQCKDGTFLSGPPSASRCDGYGGLAAVLPAPRPAPPQPAGQAAPPAAARP